MDYLHEALFLSVDVLILGLCIKEYNSYKSTLKNLKNAQQYSIDSNLKDKVEREKDKKIPFAIIRGNVKPLLGNPLKSAFAPSVTGVLQVMKLSEHRVARGFAGFWTEQRKTIHLSSNEIPFVLSNGNVGVEIVNGLGAEILDLDVVYDHYEPTSLSFFDHVFGFFSGVRQRGMQTTEQMLRDGSFITAIGELESDGATLRLQSSEEFPMFLTTATKNVLMKKFEEAKSSSLVKITICGTVLVVLGSIIGRRFYVKWKRDRDEKRLKETLERARRDRRAKNRQNLKDTDPKCVVCAENPIELIILPCGHFCICEDCSIKILLTCPICREKIDAKQAAFIS